MSELINVWYQLYGENGKPFQESTPAMVSVEAGYVVAKLKDAINDKNKTILPEKIVASFFKVYERINPNQGSSSAPLDIVDPSKLQ